MTDRDEHARLVANRLKTARGHLNGVLGMVEAGAYCPDVMKQLAAVQGLLEGTARVVLRHHLQTCVADAVRAGRTEEIVDELMETLKYDKTVFRPPPASERLPAMTTETIAVPEIHCDHCKTAIEGALTPLEGVQSAVVDVADRSVTVDYDPSVTPRQTLVDAIIDQGYEVPA